MQTVIPLVRSVRSVSHVITRPASRIPHIELHILQNKRTQRLQRQCQRPNSTIADGSVAGTLQVEALSQSEVDADDDNNDVHQRAARNRQSIDDAQRHAERHAIDALHNLRLTTDHRQAKVDFLASQIVHDTRHKDADNSFIFADAQAWQFDSRGLLDEANPEKILAWLTASSDGSHFIASASDSEFDRAFTAIEPDILVEPFKRMATTLRPTIATDSRDPRPITMSVVVRLRRFLLHIDNILAKRRESGKSISLNVCRHVLKCAAAAGDLRTAENMWHVLGEVFNVEPDLACHNHFMAAHVWNLAYSDAASLSSRIYDRNSFLRSLRTGPKGLQGYQMSSQSTDPEWTLRAQVLKIFQAISEKGFETNEDTFVNLILALAKSGDLDGVESILKSVWNIDVHALRKFDEEEFESPTFYEAGHRLVPTVNLLHAIVHAYCINNDVLQASRLLDYVARSYALDIPSYVFDELLKWHWILSIRRGPAQEKQGQKLGQIMPYKVEELYNLITDIPYSQKPTPAMLHSLISSLRERRLLTRTQKGLLDLDQHLRSDLAQLMLMTETIRALMRKPTNVLDRGMFSKAFVEFRRDFQLLFVSAITQHNYMLRHVKQLFTEADWAGSGKEVDWSRRWLPQSLEMFAVYAPEIVKYTTPTGSVRLTDPSFSIRESPVRSMLKAAEMVYQASESEDLFQVVENLSALFETYADLENTAIKQWGESARQSALTVRTRWHKKPRNAIRYPVKPQWVRSQEAGAAQYRMEQAAKQRMEEQRRAQHDSHIQKGSKSPPLRSYKVADHAEARSSASDGLQ